MEDWLEVFWADMLSEQPSQIWAAWNRIDAEMQAAVRAHLERMVAEEGWAESQQDSARTALIALDNPGNLDAIEPADEK